MICLRLIFLLSVSRASWDGSGGCDCENRDEATNKNGQVPWSYRDDGAGPSLWRKWYPDCGGKRQSPVALRKWEAARRRMPVLDWRNYDNTPNSLFLGNTGHTVTLVGSWSSVEKTPQVIFNDRRFAFRSMVLHWGANDSFGSEHTINGRRFPLEMQVIHRDLDDTALVYGGWDSPQENDRDLMICILFAKAHQPTWYTPLFETVAESLPEVTSPGTIHALDGIALNRIVPRFYRDYYMYQGSLTTPPCTQSATVIVSSIPSHVTHEQLKALRRIRDKDSMPMVDNFRPVQPLYGRCVSFIS